MGQKLEITKKLEELAEEENLDNSIVVLNLPAANYCARGCPGCTAEETRLDSDEEAPGRLNLEQIKEVIDYFVKQQGINFITINGRGDTLHPRVKEETLAKIRYAYEHHMVQAYIFTAGDNLDTHTIEILVELKANVMISLFDNTFVDADFFNGKEYFGRNAEIAENIRQLIDSYQRASQPEDSTRLGMNYVVSETDLTEQGRTKLAALKEAANKNGIFFVCNLPFEPNPNSRKELEYLAREFSDFGLAHSTEIDGRCRMGAASSVTIDYDGKLFKCPYMIGIGEGNFFERLADGSLATILNRYLQDNGKTCVLR